MYITLGLLFFLKSMGHVGHMRDIIPRNCCAKGFVTEVHGFKGKCQNKPKGLKVAKEDQMADRHDGQWIRWSIGMLHGNLY